MTFVLPVENSIITIRIILMFFMEIIQWRIAQQLHLILIYATFQLLSLSYAFLYYTNVVDVQHLILKVKYINLLGADLGHVMFIYIIVCIIKAGKQQYEAKCFHLIIVTLLHEKLIYVQDSVSFTVNSVCCSSL